MLQAIKSQGCEATGTECRPAFPRGRGERVLKDWLAVALFGLLWVDLIRELCKQWEARPQYAYGWFVPLLALGLFWRRWTSRPAAAPQAVAGWTRGLVGLVALCLLPIRVIHDINADWPLCGWLLTLGVVALSLYGIFLAGGRPWVRHFFFPVCFILVAVIWPYRIEHGLTHGLMRAVAGVTVELLGWLNVPAFQHGNLIEIDTGMVSIDEACSGIRSFQSTVMAALFLGELYLLTRPRRLALIAGGVAAALCLNVLRTFVLTWQAATYGLGALEKWHDPAGWMIFTACFACLWVMAALLRSARKSDTSGGPPPVPCAMPRAYLAALGGWALCVMGANELWYQVHESRNAGEFHWSINFPTHAPGYQEINLTRNLRAEIQSDFARGGEWSDEAGRHWRAYFFRWDPASIESVLRARVHRPDQCLEAAGLRRVKDGGVAYFQTDHLRLPFRQYTYESETGVVQVFFCQWEDGNENQGGMWNSKLADRIRSVLVGRRKLGQQTLEVIMSGTDSLKEAAQALRKEMPRLIKMEDGSLMSQKNGVRKIGLQGAGAKDQN